MRLTAPLTARLCLLCALFTGPAGPAFAASHDAVAEGLRGKAAALHFDLPGYTAMLDATAARLIDEHPGLGADMPLWVMPSPFYSEMYMRDAFWILYGHGQTALQAQFVDMFARNAKDAAWEPPLYGAMPRFLRKGDAAPRDGRSNDESTLFWVIGAKLAGKTIATEPDLADAYAWMKQHETAQGFALQSHGWIDAWQPTQAATVSANNHGLFAVALRSLRDMGVDVPPAELEAAQSAYRALEVDGYLPAYAGSSVVDVSALLGEALSLYLWDEAILSDAAVAGTVAKFTEVFYRDGDFLGYKDLVNADGSPLNPDDFLVEKDPGNYQNGGSWLLYEALALYAAARHEPLEAASPHLERFIQRLGSEIKYEKSSKEFICTEGVCGSCRAATCFCPDGQCGIGSFRYARSVYGWNIFVKRLLAPRAS